MDGRDRSRGERARRDGLVAGGVAARRRLSRLLGVEAVGRHGIAVTAVAWAGDHLQVEVAQAGAEPVVFVLGRARAGRAAMLGSGEIDLHYRGAALAPALDAAVRIVAPRALARLSLESLARLVLSDPEAGGPREPVPTLPADDQLGYEAAALLSTWGSEAVRDGFFALAELSRAGLDSLDYFNRSLFVQHSDLECVFLSPQTGVPMVPLVLYPWDDRVRRIDWPAGSGRREPEPRGAALLTTDLDEGDVVLGRGPDRLEAALDAALARAEGRMVFCSTTCVPVVSGEDTASIVERARARATVPLLSLTTTPGSMQGLLRELLVDRRLEAEARAPAPDPRSVALVGFAEDPSAGELVRLLGELGLRVVATLLPALAPALVDRLAAAALAVARPNTMWQPHYDALRHGSRLRWLVPSAPYGLAGTERWLAEVARAAGLEPEAAEVVGAAREALAPEWDRLRAEASGHGLALVVRAAETHRLIDPAETFGVPLVALLAELGFRVEVLVGERDGGGAGVEALDEALGGRARVTAYDGPAGLARSLARRDVSAVFSEQLFDRRLTERGLGAFSLQDLEPGPAGALRSLRRLVEVCRRPFVGRYGRHLARAAARRGLPDPLGPEARAREA